MEDDDDDDDDEVLVMVHRPPIEDVSSGTQVS